MKTLRSTRPKEQQKEQIKSYDSDNDTKRKMTRTEAATVIRKQYKQKKNREEATTMAKDILDDILDVVPNLKMVNGELKAKRGRKVK